MKNFIVPTPRCILRYMAPLAIVVSSMHSAVCMESDLESTSKTIPQRFLAVLPHNDLMKGEVKYGQRITFSYKNSLGDYDFLGVYEKDPTYVVIGTGNDRGSYPQVGLFNGWTIVQDVGNVGSGSVKYGDKFCLYNDIPSPRSSGRWVTALHSGDGQEGENGYYSLASETVSSKFTFSSQIKKSGDLVLFNEVLNLLNSNPPSGHGGQGVQLYKKNEANYMIWDGNTSRIKPSFTIKPIGSSLVAQSYYLPTSLRIQASSALEVPTNIAATLTARVIDTRNPEKCLFLTVKHAVMDDFDKPYFPTVPTAYMAEGKRITKKIGSIYAHTPNAPNEQYDASLIEINQDLISFVRPGVFNISDVIRNVGDVSDGDIVVSYGLGSGLKYGVVEPLDTSKPFQFSFGVSDSMGNKLDIAKEPNIRSPGGNSGSPILLYKKKGSTAIEPGGTLVGMVRAGSESDISPYYYTIYAITIKSILEQNTNGMHLPLKLFEY